MRRAQPPSRSRPSKPLCDCGFCTNKQCPNILEMIPPLPAVAGNSKKKTFGHFNANLKLKTLPKATKNKRKRNKKTTSSRPSIVDLMNDEKDCGCEIMARAVASNLHINLGLAHAREDINAGVVGSDVDLPDLNPLPK